MGDTPTPLQNAVIDLLREAAARSSRPETILFQLSEALWNAGREPEAAEAFRRAYLGHPDSGLFVPTPETDARRLRHRAASLIAHGAMFSPVIAALAVANAMLGDVDGACRLVDYDRFCRCYPVSPPAGFASAAAFNAALVADVKSDLTFYDEGNAANLLATRRSWRNNNVLGTASPACRAIADVVRAAIERYITDLPDDPDHPFIASRPSAFVLEGWAIVSRGEGYLRPHLHPRAWLSAVYYVTQPEISKDASRKLGWLRLGLPDDYGLDPATGWEERLLEPKQSMLLLMPSYFVHGTQPMGSDEDRISVAFDIVPREIAAASPRPERRNPLA